MHPLFCKHCHLHISAVWVIIISYTYLMRISAEKETHMANTKSMGRDLTAGSVPKVLLAFAAPLFLSNFLQAVYSMVDMVVVGKYVGTNGLSAVSIGSEMLHFLTFLAMGFANAGQVIIAQYTGAGQKDKIKRLIGTMFTFLAICAVVMTVAAMFLCENIMDWLNTPDLARDGARSYIMTCAVGLLFIYGYNMVSAVLRGMGDSKHPFMFIGIAAVLNLVLDLLFVGVFKMGAFGAALATVMGQGVSFVCSLVLLYRKREHFGFDFRLKSFGIHRDTFGALLGLGVPMAIQSAAINVSMLFVNSWINACGVEVSAVTGVGAKFSTVSNIFGQAFNAAGAAMVGQALGANKYDRVPKIILCVFLVNFAVTVVLSSVILLFPAQVFGIFIKKEEVQTMAIAMEYIPIAVIAFTSMAFRSCMFCLISGSGNSKLNFAVALLDGIIGRIGMSFLFGNVIGMGYFGFWMGGELAGFVPFLIGGTYFLSGRWKRRSALVADAD